MNAAESTFADWDMSIDLGIHFFFHSWRNVLKNLISVWPTWIQTHLKSLLLSSSKSFDASVAINLEVFSGRKNIYVQKSPAESSTTLSLRVFAKLLNYTFWLIKIWRLQKLTLFVWNWHHCRIFINILKKWKYYMI